MRVTRWPTSTRGGAPVRTGAKGIFVRPGQGPTAAYRQSGLDSWTRAQGVCAMLLLGAVNADHFRRRTPKGIHTSGLYDVRCFVLRVVKGVRLNPASLALDRNRTPLIRVPSAGAGCWLGTAEAIVACAFGSAYESTHNPDAGPRSRKVEVALTNN